MIIDTNFSVGDNVCYLSGYIICNSMVKKITIEMEYASGTFLMVYTLSDGATVPRNNLKWGSTILFKDKESLIKYLEEQ